MNQSIVIDIQDDGGALIQRLSSQMLPDGRAALQKVASRIKVRDKSSYDRIPDRDFALIWITKEGQRKRCFPIQQTEDVWLSSLYAPHTFGSLPKMAAAIACVNLERQATAFGLELSEDLKKFASRYPRLQGNVYVEPVETAPSPQVSAQALEKVARDPKQQDKRYWGLEVQGKMKYPLFNVEQVKTAAEYLNRHYRSLAPMERNAFAKRIVARAAEYDALDKVGHVPVLKKYASAKIGTELTEEIDLRRDILSRRNPLLGSLAEKEYVLLKESSVRWRPNQVATALEHLDNKFDLARHWDKAIQDPYAATYGGAFEKNASVSFGDTEVTEELLKKVPEAKFKSTFGEAMWNAFVQDRVAIFDHLPKPEKEVLLNMAGVDY